VTAGRLQLKVERGQHGAMPGKDTAETQSAEGCRRRMRNCGRPPCTPVATESSAETIEKENLTG